MYRHLRKRLWVNLTFWIINSIQPDERLAEASFSLDRGYFNLLYQFHIVGLNRSQLIKQVVRIYMGCRIPQT
ncbi:hypothetical protein ES703_47288 [subsurface metagenome]